MRTIWQQAGLKAIESTVIRIRVAYSDFNDFWQSNSVPVGPSGKALGALSSSELEQVKARLQVELPVAADGTISYEAFANAVQGRVPG